MHRNGNAALTVEDEAPLTWAEETAALLLDEVEGLEQDPVTLSVVMDVLQEVDAAFIASEEAVGA